MKVPPFRHLLAPFRQDPFVTLEPHEARATVSQGPELLLVMVATLAVGMGLGAVPILVGVALLGAGTGVILAGVVSDTALNPCDAPA